MRKMIKALFFDPTMSWRTIALVFLQGLIASTSLGWLLAKQPRQDHSSPCACDTNRAADDRSLVGGQATDHL